jgi:hypothetical protein
MTNVASGGAIGDGTGVVGVVELGVADCPHATRKRTTTRCTREL